MAGTRNSRLAEGLTIGVSMLAIAASADAQSTQASGPAASPQVATADAAGDAEIVVTAQKRAETLSNVPAAIQAFRGEALEQRGTNQIVQLVDFIPGASVVSNSAPGFETIQIRGISSGTVGDATVGYYIDDVAFSIPNLQLTPPSRLFDLERTEVLRGPQGTLYGNGAMGGLIRLVTAAPDLTKVVAKGRSELSFTDGGGTNYNFDGALSVPIVTDKAALRVTGGYEKLSGFATVADRPGAKDVNDTESYSIRAKLLLKPTDHLDITLSAWRISDHQNYGNNLLSVAPAVEPSSFGSSPFIRTTANLYSGLVNYDLGPVSLQSATSYVEHELKLDVTANIPGLGVRAVDDFRTHSFNEEVRVVSNGTGPFKYVIGGIYTDARILTNFDVTIDIPTGGAPFVLPFQSTHNAPLTTRSFAVYGEASYELFDGKVIPLVGLRYYNDKRTASGFTSLGGGAATFDSSAGKFHAVSPRFNLTVKPSDGLLIYGNVAKGFRSGTIQTAGQAFLAGLQGVVTSPIIKEDDLWSYELGTKLRLGRTGISLDGALYYTDYNNIQLPFTTTSGLVATVNGGDAKIYGVDLTVSWRVMSGLTLQAIGNLNKSEFRNVNSALALALATAQNGKQLPGVPKGNVTFAGNYSTPLSDAVNLNLYAAYSHRGSQTDLGSGKRSASLDQVSLRAGIDYRSWRLDAFAENATNEHGPVAVTGTAVQPLYPRRIGLAASFKY